MPAAAARSIFSASGSAVNSTTGRGAVSCSVAGDREQGIAGVNIIADDHVRGGADHVLHHGLQGQRARHRQAHAFEVVAERGRSGAA